MMSNSAIANEETLTSLNQLLDKGIDDVEAGRVYELDEAFDLIAEMVKKRIEETM